jgi:hypothetical protein
MSITNWGPTTWTFMHTLAEKIKDASFPLIGQELISKIVNICHHLPCPECTLHAKQFWSNVKISNVHSRTDLINLLHMFHNMVNKRKKTLPFKQVDLQYYKTLNIITTYNIFVKNFNTHGNMNFINESFHRNKMLSSFKMWIIANIQHFN